MLLRRHHANAGAEPATADAAAPSGERGPGRRRRLRSTATQPRRLPADHVRCRRDRRFRDLHRALAVGAASRAGGGHLVHHCRRRGGPGRDLLRRTGLGGTGFRVGLLLRLRHTRRIRGDGGRGLLAARVRRVHRRGGRRLEPVPQQAARQRLRICSPTCNFGGTVGSRTRRPQPAGDWCWWPCARCC